MCRVVGRIALLGCVMRGPCAPWSVRVQLLCVVDLAVVMLVVCPRSASGAHYVGERLTFPLQLDSLVVL